MRILYTCILSIIFVVSGFSQEFSREMNSDRDREYRTIFDKEDGNGGYGAVSMGYTRVNGKKGLIMGGRGAWLIGHGLGLGVGGYGFINEPEQSTFDNLYYNLTGGYGGLIIEPILMGSWPVHLSFPILLGAGGAALTSYTEDMFRQPESYDVYYEEASAFLVAEPGAELEFNLVRWLRLAFYANYRFTTNLTMSETQQDALTGWGAGVTLKVGVF